MDFLCLDFVNSSWYITHKLFSDPLKDYNWLMKLVENWDLKLLPKPTDAEIAQLIKLRQSFDQLLRKQINEKKLSDADKETINQYMKNIAFYKQLQDHNGCYKLHDIPDSYDWSWFMSEVAASLAKLICSEQLNNLKACSNTECQWLFIDDSKSGNRKWCDDNCATLMKVRRFREKQKKSDHSSK